jgi:hypothetical protein
MKIMTSSLALLLFAGCSDDPVSYSAPVAINLKAKSGAVTNTTISDEKGITTESGNPYAKFVTDARDRLGGDPARIELEQLTMTLGAQSTNVVSLEQIFTGDVTTLFLLDTSNNTYEAGTGTNPTGSGPVEMAVTFSSDAIAEQDWDKFVAGSFKVVVRGTAAADFATKGAEADLQLTFTFGAYE